MKKTSLYIQTREQTESGIFVRYIVRQIFRAKDTLNEYCFYKGIMSIIQRDNNTGARYIDIL